MPAKDNDRLRRITFAEAIREATVLAMEKDDMVLALGLGVTDPKGVFGTTLGLREKFGDERAYDIPVSENAVTGICAGLAVGAVRLHVLRTSEGLPSDLRACVGECVPSMAVLV